MVCLTNYTVQCKDVTTGVTGCFLFDPVHWQATGEFKAISPVFPDGPSFFQWDKDKGGNNRKSCYLERTTV